MHLGFSATRPRAGRPYMSDAPIRLYRYVPIYSWCLTTPASSLSACGNLFGGNPHGQDAKGEKDCGQTQTNSEKKSKRMPGHLNPDNVCAVDCDLSQPPGFERCLVEGGPPAFIFSPKLAKHLPIASWSHRREDTQTGALCIRDIVPRCPWATFVRHTSRTPDGWGVPVEGCGCMASRQYLGHSDGPRGPGRTAQPARCWFFNNIIFRVCPWVAPVAGQRIYQCSAEFACRYSLRAHHQWPAKRRVLSLDAWLPLEWCAVSLRVASGWCRWPAAARSANRLTTWNFFLDLALGVPERPSH